MSFPTQPNQEGDMAAPCIALLKAAETAARWHVHQKSKGASGAPYINRPLEVAASVAEATGGKDPDLITAALFHDAIEDQEIERDEIAHRFGEDVAAEVADDKDLPSEERKRLQAEHGPGKSRRAKILKLADKVSNILSIANDPPNWSARRRLPSCSGPARSSPASEAHRRRSSASSTKLRVKPKKHSRLRHRTRERHQHGGPP